MGLKRISKTPNVSGFSYNTRWKHQITSSSGMSSGMKWVRKICPWRVSIKVNFQHSCFGWYISFLWCKVFLHTPDFWKGIFFNPSTQKKAYANANPSFFKFLSKIEKLNNIYTIKQRNIKNREGKMCMMQLLLQKECRLKKVLY